MNRSLVPRIRVTHYSGPRIGGENALQTFGRSWCAIGDDDHSAVQRVADSDSAAVMKRNP